MKLLLYCTKTKPYLNDYRLMEGCNEFVVMSKPYNNLNGKIVAECDFEVEKIFYKDGSLNEAELGLLGYRTKTETEFSLLEKSCLSFTQLENYLKDKDTGYAIHIKNLHIFDKPKELYYYHKEPYLMYLLQTAPQNMCYCYEYKETKRNDAGELDDIFEKKVVISIHPEWLCKILNGEKTIEDRRIVLKEMINNEIH